LFKAGHETAPMTVMLAVHSIIRRHFKIFFTIMLAFQISTIIYITRENISIANFYNRRFIAAWVLRHFDVVKRNFQAHFP